MLRLLAPKATLLLLLLLGLGVLGTWQESSAQNTAEENPRSEEERSYRSLEVFAQALHHLSTMYVDPQVTRIPSLIHSAMRGMAEQLDPHTTFMSREMFERLHDYTKGQYGGVGLMVVHKKDRMKIVAVMKGSPAHRQGLKVDDEITAIDNVAISQEEKSLQNIRGKPGTEIILTVVRKGKPRKVRLVREVVTAQSVFAKKLSPAIVYIRITNFQEDTSSQVEATLQKYRASLKGLILDLRNNPGGLLDEAVKIADLFVDAGVIVSTMGRDPSQIEREYAFKKGTFSDFPMIVLVNRASASASEIVAGALQDHERGLVMGQQTFGKGSVQTLISLPDGGGLKITVARYYTPGGRSIQVEGIRPDILLSAQAPEHSQPSSSPTEGDLKGRIAGKNLGTSKHSSSNTIEMEHYMRKWSEEERSDYSLKSAYIYLKGWLKMKVFQNKLPS